MASLSCDSQLDSCLGNFNQVVSSARVLTCRIHTEWLDMRRAAKSTMCITPCSMKGPSVEDVHVSCPEQKTKEMQLKEYVFLFLIYL